MKFWRNFFSNFIFLNISKIHKKFKQHSINIKNYTAHPHHLVHVPAKFWENTAMRFWVTVRKLNVTDRRTGGVAISPVPGPTAPAGDKKFSWASETHTEIWGGGGGFWGVLGRLTPPTGGRAKSENDALLSYDCDRFKFCNSPAWRSKNYHPETLAAEEWQNHKAFPAGNA